VARKKIVTHLDLDVYRKAFTVAMEIFGCSKKFPGEERYSLTDQIQRSSRSVTANLAEAWRKRRYPAAFVSKLSDAEAEAAETQVWLEYSVKCGYLAREKGEVLYKDCNEVIKMLVAMIHNPSSWTIAPRKQGENEG
jgi:four helix bundle protein